MTRFVEAPPGTRVLVMLPSGYRVWPAAYTDEWNDDRTFFVVGTVSGISEHGEKIVVSSKAISYVQPALVMPVEARRPRQGLMRFTRP